MAIQARPAYQKQGPATNCVIHGIALGWLSCTCYSGAMGVDKSSRHASVPSGCDLRRLTGDLAGGTTLDQVQGAVFHYNMHTELHDGGAVVTGRYLAITLQQGRGSIVQGDAVAMVPTIHRSTGGSVNHAIWVNEVRGGVLGAPKEALVYDPAADGRLASWGRAAKGPQWWPWSLVLKFASLLRPNGPGGPTVGANKIYCLIFPDTEGSLWGSDVSKNIQVIDPDGKLTAGAFAKLRLGFGSVINISDLKTAFNKLHHGYGAVVDPSDVQWLINWANTH